MRKSSIASFRRRVKPETWDNARVLRDKQTPAESAFWRYRNILRYDNGLKFRRQAIILGWIVDFWCPSRRVVIEFDGGYHGTPQQVAKDAYRDATIKKLVIEVLRFSNEEILDNPPAFVEGLIAHLG